MSFENLIAQHLEEWEQHMPQATPPPPPNWIELEDYITYDRKKKCYQVANEEGAVVRIFPPRQKQKANRFALELLRPRVHLFTKQIANSHPALESRAWKAAQLLIAGKVTLHDTGNVVATVQGSSEWGKYTITSVNSYLVCSCPDYDTAPMIGQSLQQFCKHILAIRLAKKLSQFVSFQGD